MGPQGTRVILSIFVQNGTSGRGCGQYRLFHPHPEGLCGVWSRHLGVVCTAHCVVALRLLAGEQASYLCSI
eukprot:1136276-Pelagomonas_calceolata.AAC.2